MVKRYKKPTKNQYINVKMNLKDKKTIKKLKKHIKNKQDPSKSNLKYQKKM